MLWVEIVKGGDQSKRNSYRTLDLLFKGCRFTAVFFYDSGLMVTRALHRFSAFVRTEILDTLRCLLCEIKQKKF